MTYHQPGTITKYKYPEMTASRVRLSIRLIVKMFIAACAIFFLLGFAVAILTSPKLKSNTIIPASLSKWLPTGQNQSHDENTYNTTRLPKIDTEILLTK